MLSTVWNGDGTTPVSRPPQRSTSKPFWAVAISRSTGLVTAEKFKSTTAPPVRHLRCVRPPTACTSWHDTGSPPAALVVPAATDRVVPVAHLLGAEALHLEYPTQVVFDSVTVGVNEGARIGIVGRNGDGKSSLLGMLTGRIEPDSGR